MCLIKNELAKLKIFHLVAQTGKYIQVVCCDQALLIRARKRDTGMVIVS